MPEVEGSLLDPAVQACPFPYYKQMRDVAPVYRMPETGFYLISNYEDLKNILSDPETYSNDIQIAQLAGESAADLGRMYDEHLDKVGWGHVQTLQRTDPPEHSRYRRLINRAFTPPMVKAMQPGIERTCTELIDAFIDKGSCDFIADFAFPLPGIVIAEQIGLDATQITTFKRWSDAMLSPAQGPSTTRRSKPSHSTTWHRCWKSDARIRRAMCCRHLWRTRQKAMRHCRCTNSKIS